MSLNKTEYEEKYRGLSKSSLMSWDICSNDHHREKIPDIYIGGFQKQSLIDFPGNISSVVFTTGCNFRCSYCHNAGLVIPKEIRKSPKVKAEELLKWINNNKKMLDAVVITGGEPTLHKNLPGFLAQIKYMNLKIKLDTNGTNPAMLSAVINSQLVDYVAMDIKAPLRFDQYKRVAGPLFNQSMFDRVLKAIERLKQGDITHEFRTTVDPGLSIEDLREIADITDTHYYIQLLRDPGTNTVCTRESDVNAIKQMIETHQNKKIIHIR
jgi:pyruvate formate lyase activating enzyme